MKLSLSFQNHLDEGSTRSLGSDQITMKRIKRTNWWVEHLYQSTELHRNFFFENMIWTSIFIHFLLTILDPYPHVFKTTPIFGSPMGDSEGPHGRQCDHRGLCVSSQRWSGSTFGWANPPNRDPDDLWKEFSGIIWMVPTIVVPPNHPFW